MVWLSLSTYICFIVDGDGKYERISGTRLGGGTLFSFSYDELLELSHHGNNRITYLNARFGLKRIFFGGCSICGLVYTMDTIYVAVHFRRMSLPMCRYCGSSSAINYCWVARQPRICYGRSNDYAYQTRGHLQSPICQFCGQNPALIACYQENLKLCYQCFVNHLICVPALHTLHVIPFSSHMVCAQPIGALGNRAGRGAGERGQGGGRGHDSDGGNKRPRTVIGPEMPLLQLLDKPGPSQPHSHRQAGIMNLDLMFHQSTLAALEEQIIRSYGGTRLPRGLGIGTRLPLLINLQHTSSSGSNSIENCITDVIAGSTSVSGSTGGALLALMKAVKESLRKILVLGDFSEYPLDGNMHCTDRFAVMFSGYLDDVEAQHENVAEFLTKELKYLDAFGDVDMPEEVMSRSVFTAILSQLLDEIHPKPADFVSGVWDYVEAVLSLVITKYSDNFPQIQSSLKRAGQSLISRMKEQSGNRVAEILETEKLTDYTCNRTYMTSWTQKMNEQQSFINAVLHDGSKPAYFSLTGFGDVQISHLRKYHAHLLQKAFVMKMRIAAYWPLVSQRIVDSISLHLQLSVNYLVNSRFETEILAEMVDFWGGGRVERMLRGGEQEKEIMESSIGLLKDTVDVV
ncbi:unnamed protein product [Brassica rapa]|uniref:Dynamin stalk domain-containing protein n=1 Tax=Brassica campestris TaxID=3711 RepID=A0A3P5ZM90_BRACM|nr:unnamed protein product [Brassica rapa]VDC76554.1 unnamed protein product [Brassica rapa]